MQTTTSQPSAQRSSYWLEMLCANTTASPIVLFIFQFPAIMGFLAMLASLLRMLRVSLATYEGRKARLRAFRP